MSFLYIHIHTHTQDVKLFTIVHNYNEEEILNMKMYSFGGKANSLISAGYGRKQLLQSVKENQYFFKDPFIF